MGNTTNERNRTIDFSKGVVIFAIVISHMIAYRTNSADGANPAIDFAFSCLVLFFIISGYYFRPKRSYTKNLCKRFIQLGVTFVLCTVVLTSIMAALLWIQGGYDFSLENVLNDIGNMLLGTGAFLSYSEYPMIPVVAPYEVTHPYYFLTVMLFAFVIFYAIAEWATQNWKRTVVCVLILTAITFALRQFVPIRLPWAIQLSFVSAAYMVIGAYAGKHDLIGYIDTQYRTKRYWIIFTVMLIIGVGVLLLFPTRSKFVHTIFGFYDGWSVFPFLIITLASSYVAVVIFSFLARVKPLGMIFTFIGKHTLAVILLHMFYAKIICITFLTLPSSGTQIMFDNLLQAILVGIASTILCLITALIYAKIVEFIKSKQNDPLPSA